jgi:DNA-binding IclR family transcriptional regulator
MRPDNDEATRARRPARDGTQSIQRVAALLRELALGNRRGMSCAELAARTGIDRTTAHRMLQRLKLEDLLAYDEDTRHYSFGRLAYDIGLAASERLDLPQLCKPTLARIADDTGDTVFLMVRSGDDAVCADRAAGSYPIKTFVVDVGTRRPLGIGAGSLAILGALPDDVAELILGHNARRIATYPGMSVKQVQAMMATARDVGYVSMNVVGVPGVRAIGVPVVTAAGRPVASLSTAAITARMTPDREGELARILHRESQALGVRLSQHITGVCASSISLEPRAPHEEFLPRVQGGLPREP